MAASTEDRVTVQPRVDICIPAYNEAKGIGTVLDSLRQQTYRNIRVFVQDNASTDATPDICAAVAAQDERFVLRRNAINVGGIDNIPRALANADADFVMLRSGNDVLTADCVEKLMAAMLADDNVAMAYSRAILVDSQSGEARLIPDHFYFRTRAGDTLNAATTVMQRYTYSPAFYGLCRRSAMDKCRAIVHQYGLDHIRTCELALYGGIALVDEPLVRMHSNPHWQDMLRMAINQCEDHNRGLPLDSGFAPRIQYMPFVHMVWGHFDMFGKARIDPALKEPLCAAARDIFAHRFGAFIEREIQTYAARLSETIDDLNAGRRVFGELERGYFLRTVLTDMHRAGLVAPKNNALKDLRHAVIATIERAIGA